MKQVWTFARWLQFVLQILAKFWVPGTPVIFQVWGAMCMHGELIRAGNNHITKQFQCCNLLLVSQYWFPDNIVSLWVALASKTISGAISPRLWDWHNSFIFIFQLLLRSWRTARYDDIWLSETRDQSVVTFLMSFGTLVMQTSRLLRLLANTLPNSADTFVASET